MPVVMINSAFCPLLGRRISTKLLKSRQNVNVFGRKQQSVSYSYIDSMELSTVIKKLEEFCPSWKAEDWDNVGLLVEPTHPLDIRRILLTNDTTEPVIDEAISKNVNLIYSYHPPIFTKLKAINLSTWKGRILVKALENRIAIYCPHTSLDVQNGGLNDWLASCMAPSDITPLTTSKSGPSCHYERVTASLPQGPLSADLLAEQLSSFGNCSGVEVIPLSSAQSGTPMAKVSVRTSKAFVKHIFDLMRQQEASDPEVCHLETLTNFNEGAGRLCALKTPRILGEIVGLVKEHLRLSCVRLALGNGRTLDSSVTTVALCAGSGVSVLRNVQAEVYLTGEMSHHDILDATGRGISVILTEHSNSERGFLQVIKKKLSEEYLKGTQIMVSELDRDPVDIV